MKTMLKGLSVGVLSLASLGALSNAPAIASSLTGATIGGSAPNDYLVYDANSTNTFLVTNTFANVQAVLNGNAASPTGNVELRSSTEKSGFNLVDFTKNTTLNGQIGGKSLVLSSLTASDWFSTGSGASISYGANNLANKWFSDLLGAAGKSGAPNAAKFLAYNTFLAINGFQRTSDPNISYVNQDNSTGQVKIGLAGHLNLVDAYGLNNTPLLAAIFPSSLQASEVVKYTYDNNQSGYLYSFSATPSGLVSNDGTRSHNGNYEVTFQGVKPVPVPAGFVGIVLAGVIGGGMIKRRKN